MSEAKAVGPQAGPSAIPDLNTGLGVRPPISSADPTAAVLAFIAGQPMSLYTKGQLDIRIEAQVAAVRHGKDEYTKNLAA